MLTDSYLTEQMPVGNAEAFDALFERHSAQVRKHLLRVVRDESTADDLLQDVFLKLWTRVEQWEGRGTLAGWLTRTATNLALNHLRSARRAPHRPLAPPAHSEEEDERAVPSWMIDAASSRPDEIIEASEKEAAFRAIVDELPEQQRQVVRLVYESEMQITEVARILEVPPGTVKSRLHYARNKLARRWGELTKEGES